MTVVIREAKCSLFERSSKGDYWWAVESTRVREAGCRRGTEGLFVRRVFALHPCVGLDAPRARIGGARSWYKLSLDDGQFTCG